MVALARYHLDFIIGLFVALAVAGTVFIALRAANITNVSSSDGYHLQLKFENIGNLASRSAVKSSGVLVGRVQRISYDSEEYIALVDVVIQPEYSFPTDSIFSIVSSSLLGGQYIAIEVGGDEEMLEANQVVRGNSAIILEELISKFLFDKAGDT